jgi:hypothetical protein
MLLPMSPTDIVATWPPISDHIGSSRHDRQIGKEAILRRI